MRSFFIVLKVIGGNAAVRGRKSPCPSQSGDCDVAAGKGKQVHQGSGGVRRPLPECGGCMWGGVAQGVSQAHGAGTTFRVNVFLCGLLCNSEM